MACLALAKSGAMASHSQPTFSHPEARCSIIRVLGSFRYTPSLNVLGSPCSMGSRSCATPVPSAWPSRILKSIAWLLWPIQAPT